MPRKQAPFELGHECPSETLAPITTKITSTFASALTRQNPIPHDRFLLKNKKMMMIRERYMVQSWAEDVKNKAPCLIMYSGKQCQWGMRDKPYYLGVGSGVRKGGAFSIPAVSLLGCQAWASW